MHPIRARPVWPERGFAWVAALPSSLATGDILEAPRRSPLVLFEHDCLLGPAHAEHAVIRSTGGGSYSHWQDYLLFSTSDNSDPNHNGRTYSAVIPTNKAVERNDHKGNSER